MSLGRTTRDLTTDGSRTSTQEAQGRGPGKTSLVEQAYGRVGAGTVLRKPEGAVAGRDPGAAFAHATSGASSQVPFRGEMEAAFGHSFGNVRAHLGGSETGDGLSALGARAAAHGDAVAFRDASPSKDLVAHELAHVVQQRNGGGAVQAKPVDVSTPDDAAEQRADAAADAVMRGERVGDVGSAPAGHLHRAVDTNGGSWKTTTYSAINTGAGVGKRVGVNVAIEFEPKDPVVADNIGLTQTVKTLHSTAKAGKVETDSTVGARNASLNLTKAEGDQGRAVDQGDPTGDTIPNTSPLYAVENSAGHIAKTLTDVGANAGFGQHGFRKAKAGGAPGFDVQNAKLGDGPSRRITFAGEEFNGKFETTALVLDGPLKDTYLGSVEWGYKVDGAGTASADPAALTVVRVGAPTAQFMAAAKKWNSAKFTDPSDAKVYDTVDLPLTSNDDSGAVAANDMGAAAIIARLAVVEGQLKTAKAADKPNEEMEKTCLENALKTRSAVLDVNAVKTEDRAGGDNVFVRLSTGGKNAQSATVALKDGQNHHFAVPLAGLLPIMGPLKVELFDKHKPDSDNQLVEIGWASPYAAATNAATSSGASYNITVKFDK
jgi:hypothetical protein